MGVALGLRFFFTSIPSFILVLSFWEGHSFLGLLVIIPGFLYIRRWISGFYFWDWGLGFWIWGLLPVVLEVEVHQDEPEVLAAGEGSFWLGALDWIGFSLYHRSCCKMQNIVV
jgi:hypothetical protein